MDGSWNMFRKLLFISAHSMGYYGFYGQYNSLMTNQWKPYEELKEKQDADLRRMISYAYHNVPYYHRLFNSVKISPTDIKTSEDLERIPILTKDIIKNNWESFIPTNSNSMKFRYENHSTGGTTGTPFRYRISWSERFLSGAMMYRGWSYGGYEFGDRMILLGGSSLGVNPKSNLIKKAHEISRNIKKLSAFDMDDATLQSYADEMLSFKPKYIYGYASAINSFSKWLDERDINITSVKGIFTTSECLYPSLRETIASTFQCDVYNNYGLNDGGISAYECQEHSGLHIDMERSVMEVVDSNNQQLKDGVGRLIATSLHNYAMPFIRYETGDEGEITSDTCSCGRGLPLLKNLRGRSVDVLITPEGRRIHGWFLLYIFWEYDRGVKAYQVVQNSADTLDIKLVVTEDFDEKQLDSIRNVIKQRSIGWNVNFEFVDTIEKTGSAKFKYIINNIVSGDNNAN